MARANLTVTQARHRARVLTVHSYGVSLDLTGAAGSDTFRSVTQVRFDCSAVGERVVLDLRASSVHEVVLNGRLLTPDLVRHDGGVELPGVVRGRNVAIVTADCAYTDTGEGMHRFVDPGDHATYLYTQFEVADARRVFACFDQPDLKACFQFTVTAQAGWTVVSNTAPLVVDDRGDATVWRFAPTRPLATYVVSLAAGPYHAVRATHRDGDRTIPLGLFCRQSLAQFLDADEIFAVTRQGLDWFGPKFGYPYPFDKYDQLFVPGFNAGAMENAAAVTLNEKYVFRARATWAARQKRAATILHELSHMWFGDLVTMAWWNDLWLNESFATYCSFACQADAPGSPWADAWTAFANRQKAKAYRQDQLPSTHPIVAEIRDIDDVLVNFDGITYAKGAAVLRQLVAHVGPDAFFSGLREYFGSHAYGNTRLSDLLLALEKASGRELGSWSELWLQTAGINTLRPEFTTGPDGAIRSFRVRQEAPPLPPGAAGTALLRPHRIAVGCYVLDGTNGSLTRVSRIETDVAAATHTDVPQLVGHRAPDLVLLNDDDLSYAKVRFDARSLRTLVRHIGSFTETLPRALCWAAAWDMIRDAELAARDYLRLVLSGIEAETDVGVVESLHRQVAHALRHYADPAGRDELTVRWGQAALYRLCAAVPGSDHQHAWLRAFVAAARTTEHLDLLAELRDGTRTIAGITVDVEVRWAVLRRLAATGRAGEEEIVAELRRDPTPAGECRAAAARAARPTPAAKAAAWVSVVDRGDLPNQLQRAVITGFAEAEIPTLLTPYVNRYFAVIEDIWSGRSHEMAKQVVLGLFPATADHDVVLAATESWLTSRPTAPPALRRLVLEQYDDVRRAVCAQTTDRARSGDHAGNP